MLTTFASRPVRLRDSDCICFVVSACCCWVFSSSLAIRSFCVPSCCCTSSFCSPSCRLACYSILFSDSCACLRMFSMVRTHCSVRSCIALFVFSWMASSYFSSSVGSSSVRVLLSMYSWWVAGALVLVLVSLSASIDFPRVSPLNFCGVSSWLFPSCLAVFSRSPRVVVGGVGPCSCGMFALVVAVFSSCSTFVVLFGL